MSPTIEFSNSSGSSNSSHIRGDLDAEMNKFVELDQRNSILSAFETIMSAGLNYLSTHKTELCFLQNSLEAIRNQDTQVCKTVSRITQGNVEENVITKDDINSSVDILSEEIILRNCEVEPDADDIVNQKRKKPRNRSSKRLKFSIESDYGTRQRMSKFHSDMKEDLAESSEETSDAESLNPSRRRVRSCYETIYSTKTFMEMWRMSCEYRFQSNSLLRNGGQGCHTVSNIPNKENSAFVNSYLFVRDRSRLEWQHFVNEGAKNEIKVKRQISTFHRHKNDLDLRNKVKKWLDSTSIEDKVFTTVT
jgi:hypothetical protein